MQGVSGAGAIYPPTRLCWGFVLGSHMRGFTGAGVFQRVGVLIAPAPLTPRTTQLDPSRSFMAGSWQAFLFV